MINKKLSVLFTLSSVLLTAPLITSLTRPVEAQLISAESSFSSLTINFSPSPGDEPAPSQTVGGASRGSCSTIVEDRQPLIALMPNTKFGLTLAERPTFFVYVPDTEAKTALLTLRDQNEDYYYETMVSLPSNSGVVSIHLPADAPKMEANKSYEWNFTLICHQTPQADDPIVQGTIKLVNNLALSNQLATLSLADQAILAGEKGIWYDALASLASLRQAYPGNRDLANTWEDLLTSVGLEAIATAPVVSSSLDN